MKHANYILSFTFLGSGFLYSLTKKLWQSSHYLIWTNSHFRQFLKPEIVYSNVCKTGTNPLSSWLRFIDFFRLFREDLLKRHTNEWHEMSLLHLFESCLNPMHKQQWKYQSIVTLTQCSINANQRVSQSLLSVKSNTSLRHCASLSGRFLYIFFTLPVLLEHDLALSEQF